MIIKARNHLNKQGLLTLCYSFLYPNLTCCNHIWGNIYQSTLKQLYVTQNKIVLIIAGVKPRESAEPLYESPSIIKLSDNNKYIIARFMYKYSVGMVPKLLSSYYKKYEVSSYDHRDAECYCIPPVTTDFGKNGVRYRGAVLFNKLLTAGFNCTVSKAVFVKRLKRSIKIGILW